MIQRSDLRGGMDVLNFILKHSKAHSIRNEYLNPSVGVHVHRHKVSIQLKGQVSDVIGWLHRGGL